MSAHFPVVLEKDPASDAAGRTTDGSVRDEMAAHDLAVKQAPDSADAHAGRAWALWRAGRSPEAKQAALKALSLIPVHLPSLEVLARMALQAGDISRARKYGECLLNLGAKPLAQTLLNECEAAILKKYPRGAFDAYVSLGFNCEPGQQLVRRGYHESSFFRYTLASYQQVTDLIASDFAGVFQRQNLVPLTDHPLMNDMVRDTKNGIGFHTGFRWHLDPVTGIREFVSGQDFSAIYQEEYSKVSYLIEKWRRLTASSARVLYLMKYEGDDGRARAEAMRDLLAKKYPRHDFVLLFIQTIESQEADWGMAGIVNRYLPQFAPVFTAHHADPAGWDSLLSAFPLKSSLGLSSIPSPSR